LIIISFFGIVDIKGVYNMTNACPIMLSAISNMDSKENMNIITNKMSESFIEGLYIECDFNAKLNGFYGNNEKHVFELAIKEFKNFSIDFLMKLKNNSDPELLDVNPSEVSITIYTREYLNKSEVDDYYERNQDVYQEYDHEDQKHSNYGRRKLHRIFLSITDTLPTTKTDYLNSNDMKLYIVVLLYWNQTNQTNTKISTVEDLKKLMPPHYINLGMVQDELDKLIKYGYIYSEDGENYNVNDLGIYFLKWKQPYSTLQYNI
jgi:hypothetical protein